MRTVRRIYLTPRLDRYVDFHRNCLSHGGTRRGGPAGHGHGLAPALRQQSTSPSPIVAIDETMIGASSSTYLGGDLLDDYLGQAGIAGRRVGQPGRRNLGNKPWTHADRRRLTDPS